MKIAPALLLAFALLGGVAVSWSSTPENIAPQSVHLEPTPSGITVRGVLRGHQFIDYTFAGKTGQILHIKLTSNNSSNYFNVLAPNNGGEALFVGSIDGDEWTGPIAADGVYTIRVYLMRNAARRGEQARFTLALNLKNNTP